MRLERFTLRGQEAIQSAIEAAERNQHQQVEPEHLLLAMLEQAEGVVRPLLGKLGANVQVVLNDLQAAVGRMPKVQGGQQYFSPRTTQIFQAAQKEAEQMQDEYISTEHLLLAIAAEKDGASGRILRQHGVNRDDLFKVIEQTRGGARVTDQNAEANYQALSKYAKDLTELARQGKLDPVIGRDDEIRRTVQVLSRRTKNNPVLIGEPGVGKTAIVEGLAQRIVSGDVPETLRNKRLVGLDLGSMLAGAKYRGEFEDRLKSVLKEIENAQGQIVLFIDELHTLVGAGAAEGAIDASNMLKPALARGELRCVGATTLNEYKKHIEKDAALERRFQQVYVGEPTVEDTIAILRGLKERYEVHHGVRIKDSAIVAAATLSNRYITDRFLPDKAIDLIDEAASRLRIEIDSLPQEIDVLEREILQLEIERQALAARGGRTLEGASEGHRAAHRRPQGEILRDEGQVAVREGRDRADARGQERARAASPATRPGAQRGRPPARRRDSVRPDSRARTASSPPSRRSSPSFSATASCSRKRLTRRTWRRSSPSGRACPSRRCSKARCRSSSRWRSACASASSGRTRR